MSKSIERLVLERAIELLKQRWAMDAYAVSKNGRWVSYWADVAVGFCAVGAIYRAVLEVTGEKNERLGRSFEIRVNGPLYRKGTSLIELNDSDGDKEGVICAMRKRLAEL